MPALISLTFFIELGKLGQRSGLRASEAARTAARVFRRKAKPCQELFQVSAAIPITAGFFLSLTGDQTLIIPHHGTDCGMRTDFHFPYS